MNVWIKSTILLIFTLLIGFALGWYSSNAWEKNKREKFFTEMRAKRGSGGGRFSMPKRVGEIIQPTEAQKDTVDAIIRKYHEKFIAKSVGDFDFVRTMIDSMIIELQPVVTEDQFERLEDRRHFFRRGPGPHPQSDGPPPDGEFPDGPFNRPGKGERWDF